MQVTIELWLWLGTELMPDFEPLSTMRCARKEGIDEGMTIGQFLEQLANRYPPLAQKVFDIVEKKPNPYVVINYNNEVSNPHFICDQVLHDEDKITILPLYLGG